MKVAGKKLETISASPVLDARLLMQHVLDYNDVELVLNGTKPLNDKALRTYLSLVDRRLNSEPIAYIVGKKEFMGFDFKVGPSVLIPRPDTERLVETLLSLLDKDIDLRGFELGVGSGCISISLLKYMPRLRMWATDISSDAVDFARENAEFNGVDDRINVLNADAYDEACGGNFDFFVSNPPYIAELEYDELMPDVRLYEPRQALVAEKGGLGFYYRISRLAINLLKPKGIIALEIGMSQAAEVSEILIESGFDNIEIVKDYGDRDRVVLARLAV